MFGLKSKMTLVEPERALPGRDREMPVPERHAVLGTPLKPPFPEGYERGIVGMRARPPAPSRSQGVEGDDGSRLRIADDLQPGPLVNPPPPGLELARFAHPLVETFGMPLL